MQHGHLIHDLLSILVTTHSGVTSQAAWPPFSRKTEGGGHACHLDLPDRICRHGCDLQSRVLETASFGRPASVWFFCYAVVPHAHGWIFRPKKPRAAGERAHLRKLAFSDNHLTHGRTTIVGK